MVWPTVHAELGDFPWLGVEGPCLGPPRPSRRMRTRRRTPGRGGMKPASCPAGPCVLIGSRFRRRPSDRGEPVLPPVALFGLPPLALFGLPPWVPVVPPVAPGVLVGDEHE